MSIKKFKNLISKLDSVNPYIEISTKYKNIVNIEDIKKLDDIVLEIGCGSGKFLNSYDTNYQKIGLDIRYKRLVLAASKNPNILYIRERAEKFVDEVGQIAKEVHIYFPDPWFKKKHLKNRLMNIDFVQKLNNIMKDNSKLLFKSDHKEYFDFAKESISKVFDIEEQIDDLYKDKEISNISTEFENLFFHKNKKIYYISAKKRSSQQS